MVAAGCSDDSAENVPPLPAAKGAQKAATAARRPTRANRRPEHPAICDGGACGSDVTRGPPTRANQHQERGAICDGNIDGSDVARSRSALATGDRPSGDGNGGGSGNTDGDFVSDVRVVKRSTPVEWYIMGKLGTDTKLRRVVGCTQKMSGDYTRIVTQLASELQNRQLTKSAAAGRRDQLVRGT